MLCGRSLSHSCPSTVGGVGSSTPFVAALSGGALLPPAPLNIPGVANVVVLPAMAGSIFYCAELSSIQAPCDSLPNRTFPMNSFSNNNLGIADLRTAALSSVNGRGTLSSSNIGIADLRATALGFADFQQLPVPPPVKLISTIPASCCELFNIPTLAKLTESKPLVHQCNVHETPERNKRQDTKQAQQGSNQKTQNGSQKSLSNPHVPKATRRPRKRNLDPEAAQLLQVLIVHYCSAMCS
jgi:hypothetical protein